MMSLTSISIAHNKFRVLPAALGDMKNLEHLNIVSNSIRQLPYTMGHLANLKTIEFTDNPLSHPLEVFAQGAQATVAYLSNIQQSQKSRVLKLESIALGSFPEDALSIQGIVDLNLSNNVIEYRLGGPCRQGAVLVVVRTRTCCGGGAHGRAEVGARQQCDADAAAVVRRQRIRNFGRDINETSRMSR